MLKYSGDIKTIFWEMNMKKVLLFLLLAASYSAVYAQDGTKYLADDNWCSERSKIVITDGFFKGKYISCPKGSETVCTYIVEDLESLYKGIGVENFWLGYDQQFDDAVDAMKQLQSQKLAEVKEGKLAPFFYLLDVLNQPLSMRALSNCNDDENDREEGVLYYFFQFADPKKNKNLKRGKPIAVNAPANYTAAVGENIYIE
jgi:hypothetical protein